jgi:hypothetical protein
MPNLARDPAGNVQRKHRMNIKLHHLNLCSKDVPGMKEFYSSVLDLQTEPSLGSARDTTPGYAAPVAFMTGGQTKVHLAATDLGVAFRTKHVVNPLERGHIAFQLPGRACLAEPGPADVAAHRRQTPMPGVPDYLSVRHPVAAAVVTNPSHSPCGLTGPASVPSPPPDQR